MEAKEKAKDLFNKFFSQMSPPSDCEGCMQCVNVCGNLVAVAKSYALITVNELINNISGTSGWAVSEMSYWSQVKKEIEQYEI